MGANADDASINQKIVRILDRSDFRAIIQSLAAVAQLDRVLGYEPRGRAFESLRARQIRIKLGTSSEVPIFFATIADVSAA